MIQIQTRAAATISPGYCAIRLFLFSWLKTKLEQRGHNRENELYEVVDEVLTSLLIDMIETVFSNGPIQHLIDGNGG
jgi:hypothetical protein